MFSGMKLLVIKVAICSLLLGPVLTAIDPTQYIWFNFNTKTTVRYYSPSYNEVVLPCQARIGSCIYNFTLLPPLWTSEGNKLLIPSSQAYGLGSYAVEVKVSELTGQTLDFSLILDTNGGSVTTYSRGQYLSQNGFVSADSNSKNPKPSTSVSSSNFPSLAQIKASLEGKDLKNISNVLSQAINRNAPCVDMTSYLNDVLKLVRAQQTLTSVNIVTSTREIEKRYQQIKELESRKSGLQADTQSNTQAANLRANISKLSDQRQQVLQDYNKYLIIANSYLKKIDDQHLASSSSNISAEVATLTSDLTQLNKQIAALEESKQKLLQREANLLLEEIVDVGSAEYQRLSSLTYQYSYYSGLKSAEKVKIDRAEYEIQSLTRPNDSQSTTESDRIMSMIANTEGQMSVDEMTNLRKVLSSNLVSVEDKVRSLNSSCRIN